MQCAAADGDGGAFRAVDGAAGGRGVALQCAAADDDGGALRAVDGAAGGGRLVVPDTAADDEQRGRRGRAARVRQMDGAAADGAVVLQRRIGERQRALRLREDRAAVGCGVIAEYGAQNAQLRGGDPDRAAAAGGRVVRELGVAYADGAVPAQGERPAVGGLVAAELGRFGIAAVDRQGGAAFHPHRAA